MSSWISFVLRDLLRLAGRRPVRRRYGRTVAGGPPHETTITPSFTLRDQAAEDAAAEMISDDSPSRACAESGLAASPPTGSRSCAVPQGDRAGAGHQRPGGRWCGRRPGESRRWPSSTASLGQIHSERTVVRAFISLLERRRFFAVPADQRLPALLRESLKHQEDITEALGVQVRQAVELLVAAFARADVSAETIVRGRLSSQRA